MSHYCLFNDERQFILCVDPKCGCTTIKNWFYKTLDIERNSNHPIEFEFWMRPAKSVSLAHGYTKVWFVRDPLRRLVSFYYQFVVKNRGDWCFADQNKNERLEDRTFEDFVRILGSLHDRGKHLQHHLKHQTRHLLGTDFDAIVKIEELNDRSEELMHLLGVDIEPGHLNRQEYGQIVEPKGFQLSPDELCGRPVLQHESFWNKELVGIVRKVYAIDCSVYDSL